MMDEPEMLFVFNHGGDSAICKFERALRNEIEDHIKSLISALKRENGRLEATSNLKCYLYLVMVGTVSKR